MTDGPPTASTGIAHPDRGEIARYLLSRGLDPATGEVVPARVEVDLGEGHLMEFPDGLDPVPAPIDSAPSVDDPLPAADVVVITGPSMRSPAWGMCSPRR